MPIPARTGVLLITCAAACVGLLAGCSIPDAYDVDNDTAPPPTTSTPEYRVPAPVQAPATHVQVTEAPVRSQSPEFLKEIEAQAAKHPRFRYALDDRYRLYHRSDCPYAPRTKDGYTLHTEAGQLVHREAAVSTGTHLSRREIKAKGYRACQHCRPDLDSPPAWFGPSTEYRERQALPYNPQDAPDPTRDASTPGADPAPSGSSTPGSCTQGGSHEAGTTDAAGKTHCSKCGQFM